MVQRPPSDRGTPPGGFNPRFGRPEYDRPDDIRGDGPDPRFGGGGSDPRFDPRFERDDPRTDRPDPFDRRQPPPELRRDAPARPNRWLLILGGLLLVAAVVFGLTLTRSGPGSDAITSAGEGAGENEAAAADPEARCAAPATYDLIKRELFRQAAATRGSDQATFNSLAAYSSLRVTKPVLRERDEGLERISCGADVALDLPPGLQVVGGRRTLNASISYNLQPAADRTGDVVTLTGAEGITVPLATLARSGSAAPAAPVEPTDTSDAVQEDSPDAPAPPAVPQPPQAPQPSEAPAPPPPVAEARPTASARPSFNCARASTRSEKAVCGSSELATLDRQMASFYGSAYRGSDGQERAILERTRTRFLTYRDRCRTDACIADAYRGRITEIRDIVDGRWQGR